MSQKPTRHGDSMLKSGLHNLSIVQRPADGQIAVIGHNCKKETLRTGGSTKDLKLTGDLSGDHMDNVMNWQYKGTSHWSYSWDYEEPGSEVDLNDWSCQGLRPAEDSNGDSGRMVNNVTLVSEFFLLGFQVNRDVRNILFCLLLVVYWGTMCGNLLIITLVFTSKILHTPMYFFISQLSITDILLSTDIVPNLLHVLLNNGATITYIGCITQLYFFCASEASECVLLAVMSYDRYVAICNPLRYSSIMTSRHCVILAAICWVSAFSSVLDFIRAITKLNFCGPNIIDHLFCDTLPLLELSCSDTFHVHLEMYVISIAFTFIPTIIIVVSYTYIVSAILRIPSSISRQKAFSTCSSHLIVVSIYYGTMFSVYIVPTKGRTLSTSKILSLLYTVFTPLVNPIIYSLRNKDIGKAVYHRLHKRVTW
ncbi:olfactory receptor 1J2-like [Dendropsophus ebraccatus]|uniref:olfactory receptor 1J2-like n=1 Tax=Dendropsophus ebraccatus TaxID=150705 RepID=UPI00383138FA